MLLYTLVPLVLVGIAVLLFVWAARLYNVMIQLKVRAENAWSDIDVQLKRRYDLIPNLVATVEGYAKHERTTLQSVVDARAKAMGATNVAQKGEAENFLSGTLKSLFALAENYPQLKANENFLKLQGDLSEIEGVIQEARRYYNAVVRDFNTKLAVFPNNILAALFNFKNRDFFQLEAPEAERKAPEVKFS